MEDFALMSVKAASVRAAVSRGLGYLKGQALPAAEGIKVNPTAASQSVINPFVEEAQALKQQARTEGAFFGLGARPGFHPTDRMVGGAIGAPVGYAADVAAGGDMSTDGGKLRRAGATLGGFALGGKGLNATMNVGRKYIANTAPLYNYNAAAPKLTAKSLWNAGVMDRRMTDVAPRMREAGAGGQTFVSGHSNEARYELLRRYLGIHKPNAKTDYFTRQADGSLGLNTAVVKPGSSAEGELLNLKHLRPKDRQNLMSHMGAKTPDGMAASPRYSTDSLDNPYRELFGSHDTRTIAGSLKSGPGGHSVDRQVGDVWNFALDPHEVPMFQAQLKALGKTSPQHWRKLLSEKAPDDVVKGMKPGTTHGDMLSSFGQRTMMERLFRKSSPVIRQNITTRYPTMDGSERMHLPQVTPAPYKGFEPHAELEKAIEKASLDKNATVVSRWLRGFSPSYARMTAFRDTFRDQRRLAINDAAIAAERKRIIDGTSYKGQADLDAMRASSAEGKKLATSPQMKEMGEDDVIRRTWDRDSARRHAEAVGQQAYNARRAMNQAIAIPTAAAAVAVPAVAYGGQSATAAEQSKAPTPQPVGPKVPGGEVANARDVNRRRVLGGLKDTAGTFWGRMQQRYAFGKYRPKPPVPMEEQL